MSLHLANLSPRIRKNEIERVFRRFGFCFVHLRKGYGFVVYDVPGNAENALKSLNGKKISGETINISRSSNQLKPLKRFERASKARDVLYGRNSVGGGNDDRRNFSRDQKNFSVHDKHQDESQGTHKSTDMQNYRGSLNHSNLGVKLYNQRQESLGKGGQVTPSHAAYGSRDEQRDNLQRGSALNGPMGCDRYEPDNGDERAEQNGNFVLGGHHDNMRNHRGCVKCGVTGHEMRECPLKDTSQGKIPYHSDRLDYPVNPKARGRDSVGGRESGLVGRLQSFSRSSISARRHETDRKPLTLEKRGVKVSTSMVSSVSRRNSRNYQNRKRRREKEDQTFKGHGDKISRTSYVKAFPDSGVRFRSQSPVSHFCSGTSKSNRSRPRSMKSKSKSRSRSPNSSLPITPRRALSSSPSSSELSLNAQSQVGGPSPQSEQLTFTSDQIPQSENVVLEKGESLSGCMGNARSHEFKEVPNSTDGIPTSIHCPELSVEGTLKSGLVPQSENMVLEERELYEPDTTQVFELQITDVVPVESEHVSLFNGVRGDVQVDQSHDDVDNNSGDGNITAGEIATEKQRRTEELENVDTLEMPKSVEPTNEADSKKSLKLHNHLSISNEELYMALKYCSLKDSDGVEEHLDVEDYFGSARLWPWEIIYYRRLKKGLISTENYARRVAQNNEFGITDKYIRSSSGWGELID